MQCLPSLVLGAALALVCTASPTPLPTQPPAPTRRPLRAWRTPQPAPEANALRVTDAERECLSETKVLYPGDGRCYRLLTQGPCEASELLVLDPGAKGSDWLRPVCQRMPCAERHVFWPKDGRCYQRFRDRELLCPQPGNLLVINPFGLGECACAHSPPHLRDGAGSSPGACYALYHRGPCAAGYVFAPRSNGTSDREQADEQAERGACSRDPCWRENARAPQDRPFARWADGDGRCHELGSEDACPGDTMFGVHPSTLRPACFSREVLHLLPPTPCSGDKCTPTTVTAYSDGYIKELFHAHQANKAHHRAG